MATWLSTTKPADEETLVFKLSLLNDGQAYNNRTGVFTAPVDGVYVFLASLHGHGSKAGDAMVCVELLENGHQHAGAMTNAAGKNDYDSTSLHAVLRLTKGNRVWIRARTNENHLVQNRISFNGFLIYESS